MVLPSNLAPSAMDALLSCHGDHVFFFFFVCRRSTWQKANELDVFVVFCSKEELRVMKVVCTIDFKNNIKIIS